MNSICVTMNFGNGNAGDSGCSKNANKIAIDCGVFFVRNTI